MDRRTVTTWSWSLPGIASLALAAVLAAGCEAPVPGQPAKAKSDKSALAAPPAPGASWPARLKAVVFEVKVPQERQGNLDAETLAKEAATPDALAAALCYVNSLRRGANGHR